MYMIGGGRVLVGNMQYTMDCERRFGGLEAFHAAPEARDEDNGGLSTFCALTARVIGFEPAQTWNAFPMQHKRQRHVAKMALQSQGQRDALVIVKAEGECGTVVAAVVSKHCCG